LKNPQFERYVAHVGKKHKIVVVTYGEPAVNVAIECETCGVVLTDEDPELSDDDSDVE
jgi:hypothetical protein